MSTELPPLLAGEYLVGYLWEVGPSMSNGMGGSPITFGEIRAWQAQTGCELTVWEVRTLRRMSIAYASQAHDADRIECPAPWLEERPKRRARERRTTGDSRPAHTP